MLIDKIINTAYSFGAAIVVFGAWAKLEHRSYSDTALTVGLLTETGIFCLYGLLEWRKETIGGQPEKVAEPRGETGMGELTDTVRQTNTILHRVFRID